MRLIQVGNYLSETNKIAKKFFQEIPFFLGSKMQSNSLMGHDDRSKSNQTKLQNIITKSFFYKNNKTVGYQLTKMKAIQNPCLETIYK